jgi:L-methionine (R)-S-oxide reductase
MPAFAVDSSRPKPQLYSELTQALVALFGEERDALANLANAAALLYHSLPNLNWAGFYLLRDGELVLGPFQGRPACVRIALTRGVCGAAASGRETIVVPDVRLFPGHIACDTASRSEVVVPLVGHERLHGVLDIDSPSVGRFTEEDRAGLEGFVRELVPRIAWESL